MKYWTVLAWCAYLAAMLLNLLSKDGSPERINALYLLCMGCFFMLCGIHERIRRTEESMNG